MLVHGPRRDMVGTLLDRIQIPEDLTGVKCMATGSVNSTFTDNKPIMEEESSLSKKHRSSADQRMAKTNQKTAVRVEPTKGSAPNGKRSRYSI